MIYDFFQIRNLREFQGLVDSRDLRLNVDRERLAQTKTLKVISKKVTKKVLEMLRKMAEASEPDEDEDTDGDSNEEEVEKEVEKDEEETEEVDNKKELYFEFWSKYSKSIKLGVIEDSKNRKTLSKLLRFTSTKDTEKPISLEVIDLKHCGRKFFHMVFRRMLIV